MWELSAILAEKHSVLTRQRPGDLKQFQNSRVLTCCLRRSEVPHRSEQVTVATDITVRDSEWTTSSGCLRPQDAVKRSV